MGYGTQWFLWQGDGQMKNPEYRNELVMLAGRLGITDEMAGEEYWQQYLTVEQIEESTLKLFEDHVDAEKRVVAGAGDDMETGVLDGFADGMAIVRWDQGTVTPCPVGDIEADEFTPDYAVPPGVTLKEVLDSKGLSQADLSLRTGLAEKTISQIVNGIAPITHETAEKLELTLGLPARFWNRRELSYRESLARQILNSLRS